MKSKLNYSAINALIYILIIVALYYVTNLFSLIDNIQAVLVALTPFYLAYLISWIMYPVGVSIQKKLKISSKLAHSLAILLNLLILIAIVFILIPLILWQLGDLISMAPTFIASIRDNVGSFIDTASSNGNPIFIKINDIYSEVFTFNTLTEYYSIIFGSLQTVTNVILGTFSSAIGVVIQVFVAYIMSFYFAKDIKKFNGKLILFFEKKTNKKVSKVSEEVSTTISGYLRGLLLDCSIVSIMVTIGLSLLGIPSAFLFGVFCGLFNVIPYIGPIIGGIPVILVSTTFGLPTFILTLCVVFGTQFIEAYFLQPKIMSDAVELHPVSILVGLLVFSNIFGPIGLLISTPIMATINVILKYSKHDLSL